MAGTAGLVLAAGAGTRFGGPKALARTASGAPWIGLAVHALLTGGCDEVLVVLGAGTDEARPLVPGGAGIVVADRWDQGMAASLRAGFDALPDADAALIAPVDLPGLPPEVVRRVLSAADGREGLARAVYDGVPGHPVAVGRDHWSAFRDSLHGDEGGRRYLELHGADHVECGDLFDGLDLDRHAGQSGSSACSDR